MKKLPEYVNGGGAKSLNYSNSNNIDQVKIWPMVLRTQKSKCMCNYRSFSVSMGTALFDTTLCFLLNKY